MLDFETGAVSGFHSKVNDTSNAVQDFSSMSNENIFVKPLNCNESAKVKHFTFSKPGIFFK